MLEVIAGLVLFALVAVATPRLLASIGDAIARRQRRLSQARTRRLEQLHLQPCTRWWKPRIAPRTNFTPYGQWAYGIGNWAPPHSTCKSLGTGSPLN